MGTQNVNSTLGMLHAIPQMCGNSAVTVKTTVSKLFSSMEETVGYQTVCQTCNQFIFFYLVISVSVS